MLGRSYTHPQLQTFTDPCVSPTPHNQKETTASEHTRSGSSLQNKDTESHLGILRPTCADISFLFLSESLNLSEVGFQNWKMGLITTRVGHGDE